MNVVDWRLVAGELIAPLYAQAESRWDRDLGWNTADNWRQLEQARTTWGLPGLLAVDAAGCVRGWTYFLPQDSLLQVGGLAADSSLAAAALVDGLLGARDALGAGAVSCFMRAEAHGVEFLLRQRGFEVEPFLYLSRVLGADDVSHDTNGPPNTRLQSRRFKSLHSQQGPADPADAEASTGGAGARGGDVDAIARLLRESYTVQTAQIFAPGGGTTAWERYLRNVIDQTALGRFRADLTRVIDGCHGIEGAALVTALSPATAHIAQIAVKPSSRRRGLAEAMVREAAIEAGAAGFRAMTLLVGLSNRSARRLYERLGFAVRAHFLAARWPPS